MSLPHLTLIVVGLRGNELDADVRRLLGHGLGGVVLFRRNLSDPVQIRRLCADIRAAADGLPPPIIAVDEEGGRVQRLREFTRPVPPMREVGVQGPETARAIGRGIGQALREFGFNLDFAPVLDVDSNPDNPIIGDRAFSADPGQVAACGLALADGLEAEGVAACGKHFPGHGDASADSHRELPVIDVDEQTLWQREIVPFAAAIEGGIRMLMTAHCFYPRLGSTVAATLSRPIVTGLLRERLGFDGVVITDDLGMKAIADRYSPDEILAKGLDAGVDAFLQCGGNGEGVALAQLLDERVERRQLDPARVAAASARVWRFREGLSPEPCRSR